MSSNLNNLIKLNVGGTRFETRRKNINIKHGRLWRINNTFDQNELSKLCDDFNSDLNEFYFDRDPTFFNFILNYYRTGYLHVSDSMCPVKLNNELIYWDLNNPLMDVCCEEKLESKRDNVDDTSMEYLRIIKEVQEQKLKEFQDKSNRFKQLKNKLRSALDDSFASNSSLLAKVLKFIEILFYK